MVFNRAVVKVPTVDTVFDLDEDDSQNQAISRQSAYEAFALSSTLPSATPVMVVFSTLKLYIISNFVFLPLVTNPSLHDFGFDENPSGKHTIINGEYKLYEAVEDLTVTLKERMLGVGMNAALWGLKPVYDSGRPRLVNDCLHIGVARGASLSLRGGNSS